MRDPTMYRSFWPPYKQVIVSDKLGFASTHSCVHEAPTPSTPDPWWVAHQRPEWKNTTSRLGI